MVSKFEKGITEETKIKAVAYNYCLYHLMLFMIEVFYRFAFQIHEYAERLASTLPEPLNNVYLVNSGSEANDMAAMMARLYTGNHDIITLRNAYHGN